MALFLFRRVGAMAATLVAISLIAFAVIELPPGDFATAYVAAMQANGVVMTEEEIAGLRATYGLDGGVLDRYFAWIYAILRHGDFGQSFEWRQPVSDLIWGRVGMSMVVELSALIVMWCVALPIGVYSAVRRYTFGDYAATLFGFLGLAVPNFLLALGLMYVSFRLTGKALSGLNDDRFIDAPWDAARLADFLGHLWAPVLVLATAGMAHLIRVLRANLLDELNKPYVVAARARGLPEGRLVWKYPVRVALNPLVSSIGLLLPTLISSSVVVGVVMSLPTSGPLLLRALMSQDTYLAGAFVLLMGVLAVIGTAISDMLLAAVDPRVRHR
ncbi:MAG: ABC transporter permease [Elioraea sp.]|nr:ABC transporter permease [Elioraea sp.]MDW8443447.1 ABC transporter permease [Acetobacteraceae bacterium]